MTKERVLKTLTGLMGEAPQIEFLQKELNELSIPLETSVNPNTGANSISVGILVTSGRQDFTPQLSLSYSSGSGNSVFGRGWNLSGLSSISIDTKNGFPRYNQADKYALDGSQLVPYLKDHEKWVRKEGDYIIHHYRARWEQSFQRVEYWKHKNHMKSFWVVRNPDNTIAVYGKNPVARLADPENEDHIFSWLLQAQYDQKGNVIRYEYKKEDDKGIDKSSIFEFNRFKARNPLSQRYLKRIHYGNDKAVYFGDDIANMKYHFEIVLDYGDHSETPLKTYDDNLPWPTRADAYSSFGTGFEIRTWRLCRRILMFHHFPNEEVGNNAIVGATQLNYATEGNSSIPNNGAILENVKYTGDKKLDDKIWQESIPPISFHYQEAKIGDSFTKPIETDFENMPYGLGEANYSMVDLYGEGVPGILFETDRAWFYKDNLGEGNFGKLHQVAEKPVDHLGGFAISDFDNNGNPNLVALKGSKAGYYEYDRDQQKWSHFQTFAEAPSVEQGAQLMDINGDGKAELVIFKQDRITYYPSKGKEGFSEAIELSRAMDNGVSHLPTLGDNLMLDYFTADMTGDGSPDQVRVLNGSVAYWSHLGHGRYTEGTIMANAPILEEGFEFDAARIRLVDLTGSGTSDLLYIGRGEIRYWINESGNRFSTGKTIRGIPYIENFASIQIADLLGNGTPCLVWSSALPSHGHTPIQYLPLVGERPPGLLVKVENGMGMEMSWSYGYSAKQYLLDKKLGEPWLTHLPSHSYVVEQEIVEDKIANTFLVTAYRYHDGFYDSEEREFRGFGFVEQYDTATLQDHDLDMLVPTAEKACIKTWFHNGASGWDEKRRQQYYVSGRSEFELSGHTIENLDELGKNGFGDAFRSLAGQVLRTEVYGHEEKEQRSEHPYQIQQSTYLIRQIQVSRNKEYGCFVTFSEEQLSCNYEKEPENPLVSHTISLVYDAFGIPIKQCAIGYPNEAATDMVNGQSNPQKRLLLNYSEQEVTHFKDENRYELGIPLASKSYEIDGSLLSKKGKLFTRGSFLTNSFSDQLVVVNLRIWQRTFYTNLGDMVSALPYGLVGDTTLLQHEEIMVGTLEDFEMVFSSKGNVKNLLEEGKYHLDKEVYWQSSEILTYRPSNHFFLPKSIEDFTAKKGTTALEFDSYHLILQKITDRFGFYTRATLDYYSIAPKKIVDVNENVSEVIYDPLGMIRVSTMHGEIKLDTAPQPYGNAEMSTFDTTVLTEKRISEIIKAPEDFLQSISSFYSYDLFAYRKDGNKNPITSIQLLREQFVNNGKGSTQSDSQIQLLVTHTDGFGRAVQTAQKVEAGEAIKVENGEPIFDSQGEPVLEHVDERWLVSGHTVYDRKQQPTKQYEPFFFPQHEFTNHEKLQQFGFATEIKYDALGRAVKTTLPNLTYSRVVIGAWKTNQFDANDTLLENDLYQLTTFDEHEQTAITKAREHAETPTIIHLDTLGREVIVEEVGKTENRISITEFDFYDNPLKIIDPRKIEAFNYSYDRAGNLLYVKSVDAGEKWLFQNVVGFPLQYWDGRGLHQTTAYDDYNRPLRIIANGLEGYDLKNMQQWVYGDYHALRNANGLPIAHFDEAGLQTYEVYDIGGTPLHFSRQVTKNFKTEPDWASLDMSLLSNETFTTHFELDALGRPVQEHLADGTSRKYSYHLSGGLQSLKVSSKDGTWQDKDILKDSVYNAKGQKTGVDYGNKIRTRYRYDARSFQLKQLHSWVRRGANNHDFQNLRYTYDPVGNITRIENTANNLDQSPIPLIKEYTYDTHYQLIEAQGVTHQALFNDTTTKNAANLTSYMNGARANNLNDFTKIEKYTRTYTYDLSGNRIAMRHRCPTKTFNAEKRISQTANRSLPRLRQDGREFTEVNTHFDNNGNCLYMPHLAALRWNYRNNIELASRVARPNGLNDTEYYQYGGDGLRVRKVNEVYGNATNTKTTTETIYCYGCEVIRKIEGNTLTQEHWLSYFKDGDTTLARGYRWTIDRNGALTGTRKLHYYLTDHLGSSTAETSEDAELISFEEYFPFGNTAFILGDHATEIRRNEYRYSGKERDDFTGLYNYGYRYYAPWLSNWINPDPIGPEDGLNLFRFVWNNPIVFTDRLGLETVTYENGVERHIRKFTREEIANIRFLNPELADKFETGEYIFRTDLIVEDKTHGLLRAFDVKSPSGVILTDAQNEAQIARNISDDAIVKAYIVKGVEHLASRPRRVSTTTLNNEREQETAQQIIEREVVFDEAFKNNLPDGIELFEEPTETKTSDEKDGAKLSDQTKLEFVRDFEKSQKDFENRHGVPSTPMNGGAYDPDINPLTGAAFFGLGILDSAYQAAKIFDLPETWNSTKQLYNESDGAFDFIKKIGVGFLPFVDTFQNINKLKSSIANGDYTGAGQATGSLLLNHVPGPDIGTLKKRLPLKVRAANRLARMKRKKINGKINDTPNKRMRKFINKTKVPKHVEESFLNSKFSVEYSDSPMLMIRVGSKQGYPGAFGVKVYDVEQYSAAINFAHELSLRNSSKLRDEFALTPDGYQLSNMIYGSKKALVDAPHGSNPLDVVEVFYVPSGATILRGRAGPQTSPSFTKLRLKGGGNQVYIHGGIRVERMPKPIRFLLENKE